MQATMMRKRCHQQKRSGGDNENNSNSKAVAPVAEARPSSDDTDEKMPEMETHPSSGDNVVEKDPTITAASGSQDVPAE